MAAESPAQPEQASVDESARGVAEALFAAEARACVESPLRRPCSTYRLQVHGGFRLDDVARIVDYLADLGISDGYFSPYLAARPGSTHGYDVFDHNRINPEIGDEPAHQRLLARLEARGLGRVLDIVPNHMGVGGANLFWNDVLETGPQARSARFFDIDWSPVKDELEGRLLLPLLEDLYGKVLAVGLLVVERDGGSLWVRYRDHRFPLHPKSYAQVLDRRAEDFHLRFEPESDDVLEYLSIADSARRLPQRDAREPGEIAWVRRETEVIKRRLGRLCERSPRLREFVDGNIASFQGIAGNAASFDAMHHLLESQAYRLAYWRVASEEINYRRFFDISELAGLRAEDPEVFALTHTLIFRWAGEGGVTGLRIDHPDGLVDPLGYFRRLQEQLFLQSCRARLDAEGRGAEWPGLAAALRERYQTAVEAEPSSPLARRFPIVAEKILSPGESLPADWSIDGTVGYEYLNVLNGLFVDPEGEDAIDATYRTFTGDLDRFANVLHEGKLFVENGSLASEINMLTRQLGQVAERDRVGRDFTHNDLRRAIREVIACFRVYRTYLRPGSPVSAIDRAFIEQAVAKARQHSPALDESLFSFLRDVLLLKTPEGLAPSDRAFWERFVIRFQQTTGPVQAKGLEDTSFYRQVRLASLNEVGGNPARFGNSPGTFHALNLDRLRHWPGGLSTTATHDTKRGEDARVRINVLSELTEEWKKHLNRWSRWNERRKTSFRKSKAPDAREEHLLYQTLIGAWPFGGPDDSPPEGFVERIQAYLVKAAREAKLNTSWTDSDPTYAENLRRFVHEILEGAGAGPFLADFLPFQRMIARVGVVHSLAQALLKLASPGVADVYQGCELWDFNLVDPDNRRAVDFDQRGRLLDQIRRELDSGRPRADLAGDLFNRPEDGAIKLYLTWVLLNHRKANQDLYLEGDYEPLEALGPQSRHVAAFLRRRRGRMALAVAPRLVAKMMGAEADRAPLGRDCWGESKLILPQRATARRWRNLLTDETVEVPSDSGQRTLDLARIFQVVPLALLVDDD